MSERYKPTQERTATPEGIPVTEQEVMDALDAKGLEDPETSELYARYVEQCWVEAKAKGDAARGDKDVSNKASIEADLQIVSMLAKTKNYRGHARELLEDTYRMAEQQAASLDLEGKVRFLYTRLNS